jgi:hypothetical protein
LTVQSVSKRRPDHFPPPLVKGQGLADLRREPSALRDEAQRAVGLEDRPVDLVKLADFQDPENYFDQLRKFLPQFGFRNPKLFALVARADAEPDLVKRAILYQRASQLVMNFLPMVPYVNFKFAVALRRNVTGYVPDPSGPINESFATVGFASR